MKLQLSSSTSRNLFTGYGAGYVAINGARHERHLIVTDEAVESWEVTGFALLAARHFERIAALRPDIVLLGTGSHLRFPAPDITQRLVSAGIGLEAMDTGAACRTFNVLAAEGRRVVAAVLVE